MPETPADLFARAANGDAEAMNALYAALYPEIKRVARSRLAQAGGVTGLNATALVHEGFMRMAERQGLVGETRVQFFAYVGKVLRSIVIDFIRSRDAEKRGGGATLLTLSHADAAADPILPAVDVLALDRALEQLKVLDAGMYHSAELHFFCGMTIEETASARGVSSRTVNREIARARALLANWLEVSDPGA
ncbi:MAG: sigma-70 family RNA polymerase sigma factor [Burkholderiales bacterium]|nr:sigma-70 family RNA polymerase sigma factor [Pseudomonadota bacterium]MCC7068296.1 sigma-70 family RNA polymerase sigma factor [Burkholderiales bacterium]MCZ2135147.1 sigma-70 family RNA polymerase sigma factor [Burkholderiales bacterium]